MSQKSTYFTKNSFIATKLTSLQLVVDGDPATFYLDDEMRICIFSYVSSTLYAAGTVEPTANFPVAVRVRVSGDISHSSNPDDARYTGIPAPQTTLTADNRHWRLFLGSTCSGCRNDQIGTVVVDVLCQRAGYNPDTDAPDTRWEEKPLEEISVRVLDARAYGIQL
jgi:hypothetical protein